MQPGITPSEIDIVTLAVAQMGTVQPVCHPILLPGDPVLAVQQQGYGIVAKEILLRAEYDAAGPLLLMRHAHRPFGLIVCPVSE